MTKIIKKSLQRNVKNSHFPSVRTLLQQQCLNHVLSCFKIHVPFNPHTNQLSPGRCLVVVGNKRWRREYWPRLYLEDPTIILHIWLSPTQTWPLFDSGCRRSKVTHKVSQLIRFFFFSLSLFPQ